MYLKLGGVSAWEFSIIKLSYVLMDGELPVAKQVTPLPLNSLTGYSLRREYE
jgi:hypothetical protein